MLPSFLIKYLVGAAFIILLLGGGYAKGRYDQGQIDNVADLKAQLALQQKITQATIKASNNDQQLAVKLKATNDTLSTEIDDLQSYARKTAHSCLTSNDVNRLRRLWK